MGYTYLGVYGVWVADLWGEEEKGALVGELIGRCGE